MEQKKKRVIPVKIEYSQEFDMSSDYSDEKEDSIYFPS